MNTPINSIINQDQLTLPKINYKNNNIMGSNSSPNSSPNTSPNTSPNASMAKLNKIRRNLNMDFDNLNESNESKFKTPIKYPSIPLQITHPLTPKKIIGSELEYDQDILTEIKTSLFTENNCENDNYNFQTPTKPTNKPSFIPNAPVKSRSNLTNADFVLESIEDDVDNEFNYINRRLIFA